MSATLSPLAREDFAAVKDLAHAIWNQHYVPIIGQAQVDYMLGGRFTPERLAAYLDAPDRWFRVLRVDGALTGYLSYALTGRHDELKLEQLYVLPAHHGKGLGGMMMRHVEAEARRMGRLVIMLTVNRHNTNSLAVYRKSGFTVREEVKFDIGQGYVMDDFVMEKHLEPPRA